MTFSIHVAKSNTLTPVCQNNTHPALPYPSNLAPHPFHLL